MKQEDLDNEVNRLLKEVDALAPMETSGEWEQELFAKLSTTKRNNQVGWKEVKTAIVVIVFLLINGLVFLQPNHSENVNGSERQEVLQNISSHLLINATASN